MLLSNSLIPSVLSNSARSNPAKTGLRLLLRDKICISVKVSIVFIQFLFVKNSFHHSQGQFFDLAEIKMPLLVCPCQKLFDLIGDLFIIYHTYTRLYCNLIFYCNRKSFLNFIYIYFYFQILSFICCSNVVCGKNGADA